MDNQKNQVDKLLSFVKVGLMVVIFLTSIVGLMFIGLDVDVKELMLATLPLCAVLTTITVPLFNSKVRLVCKKGMIDKLIKVWYVVSVLISLRVATRCIIYTIEDISGAVVISFVSVGILCMVLPIIVYVDLANDWIINKLKR